MQLATLLIGLISATALWSGVQAINQQARNAYDRAAATFGGVRTASLVAPDAATFPQELFVRLARAGWPVSPVLEGRVQVNGKSFRLLGIEPVTLPADVGSAPRLGESDLRAFVAPPGQTLAARETLADLQATEGASPRISSGAQLPPLHVLPQLVPDVLVVDIGVAQRLLNKPDQVSRLLIGKAKGKPAPLESVTGDRLKLVPPSAETELERLTDSPLVGTMASRFMGRIVGEVLQANKAVADKVPGLGSLMSFGTSAASKVMGAADRQFEGLIGDTVGKGGTFAVRRLNRIIIETLQDPTTREAVLQVWDLVSEAQVAGLGEHVTREEVTGVLDAVHEVVVTTVATEHAARLGEAVVDAFFDRFGGYTPTELLEYVGHRWWPVEEIAASEERFFPGRLPSLIEDFLAGEDIDEPFDAWN